MRHDYDQRFVCFLGVSIMFVPTQTEEHLTIQPSNNVEIELPVGTVTSLTKNEVAVVAASVHAGAQVCYQLR